tara:strand:- start:3850 stop:4098 length:249 start_codon:yes stop_codon:yes gene_type:complete
MKDKNLPPDINTSSLEDLTNQASQLIDLLENEKDLNNLKESYQKLLHLNIIIEKKFHKNLKFINEETKKKVKEIFEKHEKKT